MFKFLTEIDDDGKILAKESVDIYETYQSSGRISRPLVSLRAGQEYQLSPSLYYTGNFRIVPMGTDPEEYC